MYIASRSNCEDSIQLKDLRIFIFFNGKLRGFLPSKLERFGDFEDQ
jgi:hypothetical protein